MLRSGDIRLVMAAVMAMLMLLLIPMALVVGCGRTTFSICRDPIVDCMKGCDRYLDPKGCAKCDCKLTCENVRCPEICELQEMPCLIPPCPVHPVCVQRKTPCPWIKCGTGCKFVRGPDGCVRCN